MIPQVLDGGGGGGRLKLRREVNPLPEWGFWLKLCILNADEPTLGILERVGL